MAHFNDQPLSHHEGWSNITLILNNGHNGATAHEYECPSEHRCGVHSCHHNMLLLYPASLIRRQQDWNAGSKSHHLSQARPERNFFSASQQHYLLPSLHARIIWVRIASASIVSMRSQSCFTT